MFTLRRSNRAVWVVFLSWLAFAALLWVVLWWTTPPAHGQPIVIGALTTAMSRNNESPSCVHEQVGRPFAPYSGSDGQFDHAHPDCPPSEQLAQFMTWSNSPCSYVAMSWQQPTDDAWEPWGTVLWAPDGTLRELSIIGARRAWVPLLHEYGIAVGQWSTGDGYGSEWPAPVPGVPTWDEFRAGAPIAVTIDWCTANDWIMLTPGAPGVDLEAFSEAHGGLHPTNALLDVELRYLGDVEPMVQDGHGLLGGSISATVDVRADPDWDRNGAADVPDVFGFLSDWSAGADRAGACDGDRGCQVADVFAFLNAWFAGG